MSSITTVKVTPKTSNDKAYSFAECKLVKSALQPYIEAATTGDDELFRIPFYDHAYIIGSVNSTFENAVEDEFTEALTEIVVFPKIQHHIAWIDISGPVAAARVKSINWSGFRFTDFLVIYNQNEQWKASGKVYDAHSQN